MSETRIDPAVFDHRSSAAPTPRQRVRRHLADIILVVVLAGLGAMVGRGYYAAVTVGAKPAFYQLQFAPAVMEACGRGFVNPIPDTVPVLTQFLTQQRATLDCAGIPATVPLRRLAPAHVAFRYLLFAVATYWRVTGVSWDLLAPLFGALHGAVVALVFLAFRLVLARWLALPLSVALAFSPAQLSILPYLRDSAKVPFFMADALIVLLVWTRPFSTRTLVVLCALFGLVAGAGLGFRPDVVTWFPMLAIALLFRPHANWRRRVTATALGLALAAAAFAAMGWPVLKQYKAGSNFGHVALLGFAPEFDTRLGIRSDAYTIAPFYDDLYMFAAIQSYATRQGYRGNLRLMTVDYERYASSYYSQVVRTFAADVLTRVEAAVLQVLNLPFARQELPSDTATRNAPLLHGLLRVRHSVFGVLDGWGAYVVLLAFLMLAARSSATAWGFAFTVLYLAGLPVVQFHLRHYSHLEVIGLLALGLVAQSIARHLPAVMPASFRLAWAGPLDTAPLVRVVACLVAIVLIPLLVLQVLRSRQQLVVHRLLDSYDLAAAESVPYAARVQDADHVVIVPDGVPLLERVQVPAPHVYHDFLAVDLVDRCDAVSVTMRLEYRTVAGAPAFPRDVPVSLWPARETGAVRVFLPIYQFVHDDPVGFRFEGIQFLTRDLPCLAGLRRVAASAAPSLWVDLTRARNWMERPLYQTLASPLDDAHQTTIYRSSPALPLRRRSLDALTRVAPGVASASRIARVDPSGGLRVDGVTDAFAYLAMSRPATVAAGSQLVAVGELLSGGLTVGLLKEDAWSRTVNITRPGPFVAAVDAAADGTYVAVIANVNRNWVTPTRFVITGMDWAPPAARLGGGSGR